LFLFLFGAAMKVESVTFGSFVIIDCHCCDTVIT
jgi:hypothetical protein